MAELEDPLSIIEIICSNSSEKALDDLALLFAALMESLSEGVALVENGLIRMANSKIAFMTGFKPCELIGMSLKEIFAFGGSSLETSRDALPSGPSEGFVLCKDARKIHVEVRRRTIAHHKRELEIISLTDLTDLDLAKHLVNRHGEYFRSIFEGVPDIVFIEDSDLKFLEVNPALARLVARPAQQIVGLTASDLYGEAAGERIRQWDERVLSGELLEEVYTVVVNGQPITLHEIRVPVRSVTGQIIGVCGIARNVSERKSVASGAKVSQTVYRSRAITETLQTAARAAELDGIVLLSGESGTGKDYVAQWIHDHSARSGSPFFPLNCAALSSGIAESELFGHEAGSFTGASSKKRGLLELAEGGTLLLNEIGELILPLQSKLLTFLDTKSFIRVGGEKSIRVDARLMAATSRDLREEVAEGRFLEPLYYRLNVLSIHVPPLRDRVDDIPILVRELVRMLAIDMHLSEPPTLSQSSLEALMNHNWPGNVRELRNVLERALILCGENAITITLPDSGICPASPSINISYQPGTQLRGIAREAAKAICLEVLKTARGNKRAAAKALGISRETLYRHIRE